MKSFVIVSGMFLAQVAVASPWLQPSYSPASAGAAYHQAAADAYKKAAEVDKPKVTNPDPTKPADPKPTPTESTKPSASSVPVAPPTKNNAYKNADAAKEAQATAAERAAKPTSPRGIAFFPSVPTTPGQKHRPYGFVEFVYTSNSSAKVEVRLGNFPEGSTDGFTYHIHTDRVPDFITDPLEQCKAAKGHLDTAGIADTVPCNVEKKSSCQVGDLSGKWGKVPGVITTSQIYKEVYDETYLSWIMSESNFFVNRSIVIHEASTKARIACANILAM